WRTLDFSVGYPASLPHLTWRGSEGPRTRRLSHPNLPEATASCGPLHNGKSMQPQLSSHPDPISPALALAVAGAPSRRRQYIWLALLLAGPLLLLLLRLFPSLDQSMFHDALGHVVITSSAAIIGVILALLVLHVAQRARDGRVFLIGMGFLSSTSIF